MEGTRLTHLGSLVGCRVLQELERVVERGVQEMVDPQADEDMEDEGGEGQGVYCVTCGHEVVTRRAIKHMENCFNKVGICITRLTALTKKSGAVLVTC